MFDISSGKLILIGVVALVVVGPKELPGLLRQVGRAASKLRDMAGEFRQQFDEAMREAELSEVTKTVDDVANMTSTSIKSAFDPITNIHNEIGNAVTLANVETQGAVGAVSTVETNPIIDLPPPPEPAPIVFPDAVNIEPDAKPKPRARKKVAAVEPESPAVEEIVPAPKPRAPRKKKTAPGDDDA